MDDVPARALRTLELDGPHEPAASLAPISWHAVYMPRPQALRTVVAKPSRRERQNFEAANAAGESVVTRGKEVPPLAWGLWGGNHFEMALLSCILRP